MIENSLVTFIVVIKVKVLHLSVLATGRQQSPVTAGMVVTSPLSVQGMSRVSGRKAPPATALIGGHFSLEVRRALLLVRANPKNTCGHLNKLLGQAINDLCAKCGKPQPYSGEGDCYSNMPYRVYIAQI